MLYKKLNLKFQEAACPLSDVCPTTSVKHFNFFNVQNNFLENFTFFGLISSSSKPLVLNIVYRMIS